MGDGEIHSLFEPLNKDIMEEEGFGVKKPLLAHYTSITVLESILRAEELWFSNPLFMNDTQEIRFAINEGISLFRLSEEIEEACKSKERYDILSHAFEFYVDEFIRKDLFDTYIFCLSEHDPDDKDGRLSMWRGYGGNGNGAALVFDTGKIQPYEGSPLVAAKVHYATLDDQRQWLSNCIKTFSRVVSSSDIPNDKLYIAAWSFFDRLKLFSVFTKHGGFREEQEWRVVYIRNRDEQKLLDGMFHDFIGPRGVEPKLKFKVRPTQGVAGEDLVLSKIVERIILGPSVSSPISKAILIKMLGQIGRSDMADRVHASTIPFRLL